MANSELQFYQDGPVAYQHGGMWAVKDGDDNYEFNPAMSNLSPKDRKALTPEKVLAGWREWKAK